MARHWNSDPLFSRPKMANSRHRVCAVLPAHFIHNSKCSQ